ncbi:MULTISPECIES: hypothetical protein [Bacillus]|uniref:hypothetical protein n=1 Tax=Bacillus TaxID=1386 RepID=UPI0002E29CC4|nr:MULTISPECIES: hypothetical protein [Bacillus]
MEESIYFFKVMISCLLGVQSVSVFLFLTVEWAMVDFYKLGTFDKPESVIDKITNFFMKLFLGSGYFFYNKFRKHTWILRKLYMLFAWVVQGILFIIIFNLITIPLDLFLK